MPEVKYLAPTDGVANEEKVINIAEDVQLTGLTVVGAITANTFVHIFDDAGTPKMRTADTDGTNRYFANGYVTTSFSDAATDGVAYRSGKIPVTGATAGETAWLATNGSFTHTKPSGGLMAQVVGLAINATEIDVKFGQPVVTVS